MPANIHYERHDFYVKITEFSVKTLLQFIHIIHFDISTVKINVG